MTPPKISSVSSEQNYSALEPQVCVAEQPAQPVCSSVTQQCYASGHDFLWAMKQYQTERRLANAASIFQKDPPLQLQAKKEDPVDSMWGGVKSLWNNGDHALSILAGAGATVGTVLVAFSNLSCSSQSNVDNTHPEVPDASPPPPTTDPSCDGRRTEIQNATSDPSLKSLVDGITLPTLDVTYQGTPFVQDSNGATISTIKCSDPKAWAKVGDRLFVLTANKIDSGYAPATLLVYKVNADNSLTPVTTDDIANNGASNAIVFYGQFNPVGMTSKEGNTELDILFGAPTGGQIATVDPFSLTITQSDWCSTHGVDGGTGTGGSSGTGGSDSGTGGTGGTGGTSGDGGKIDGGIGGDAGKMDGGAGEAGSPSDAGAKG
jgi:hypothetical protein